MNLNILSRFTLSFLAEVN